MNTKYLSVGENCVIAVYICMRDADAIWTEMMNALKTHLPRYLLFGNGEHVCVNKKDMPDKVHPIALKTCGMSWTFHFEELGTPRILLMEKLTPVHVLNHTLVIRGVLPQKDTPDSGSKQISTFFPPGGL